MKKISLLLLLAFLGQVQAQRINAYINSGLMTSQIEGDELKGFDHWGYTGGVGAIVNLTDNGFWSLGIETDYSCRGVFNNLKNSSNPYNIRLNMHYVDIPLTLYFSDPYGGVTVGAGFSYGRLLAQPHGKVDFNPDFYVPDSSDMAFLKHDVAAALEIRFPVWNNLYLSGRFQYSIIPVKRDWHFSKDGDEWTRDCYNSALSFRLLWQFGDGDNHKYAKKKKGRRR